MKNAIKKIMAFVLVIAMVAGVLPSVFAASEYVEPFKDVKTTDWFAPYVTYVYEHDPQLMNGVTKDTFAPNGTCTRAMAAVVLYRLADPVIPSVKPSTFTDLTQDWYKNGIAWAQQNGVVNGVTETTFVPDGLVLREQLVTMLWRYAGEPKVAEDYLKSFPDREKVSYYAREAFNWAISLEIIGGANGMLNPQGNATRAEFAKILSVFAQKTAPCQHKWDEGKVTKEATCTATGVMTYTCTLCGETKTETIPMIAHNYVDGVCSVCGAEEPDPGPGPGPEPTPGDDYVLAASIKGGDEVVIYNPGHGMAIKNETDNDWYLMPETVTPTDNKIVSPDASLVWTVVDNGNGTFSFVNGANKIMMWLSESNGKTYFELTNNADYPDATGEWKVISGDASNNLYYIQHSTLSNSYGPAYIECYYNSNKDTTKISGYSTSSPTANDYGFQFYVKGGTAPDPGPGPEPSGEATIIFAPNDVWEDGTGYQLLLDKDAAAYGTVYDEENGFINADEETGVVPAADYAQFEYKLPGNADGDPDTENVLVGKTATVKVSAGTYDFVVTNPSPAFEYTNEETGETVEIPGCIYYVENGIVDDYKFEAGKTYTISVVENPDFDETDENSPYDIVKISVDGVTPEPTPGNEYVLTSELKEGDEVVIVCAAKNVALGNTYSGYYNNAIAVTPENGKIVDPSADVVWTVGKEGEFYTFSFNGQKIAMGTGFTSMPLGEVNYKWQLQNAATEGAFYLANLDREAGKEYRMQYQEAKGTWSAYHTIAEGAEDAFALNFYVKGGEAACAHEWDEGKVTTEATCTTAGVKTFTCALCGNTKTESIAALGHIDENNDEKCDRCGADLSTPDAADYVLASELKDGDEVIIVNVDVSKAMSEDAVATKYRAGVDVTPENDTITTNDSKIVWDVVAVDGGFQFQNDNGETLSATSGLSFASTDNVWALTAGTAENTFIISSTTATGSSGDPKSIEWFATYNEFSTYYKNNDNENLFAVKLYVKGAEAACKHEWDEGKVTTEATCTTDGVKTFTCALCGNTKTESIVALGHIDENNDEKCDRCEANLAAGAYSVADTLAVGDKIVLVIEYDGKFYAAANDNKTVSNALNAIEVDVNDKGLVLPDGVDVVWEVCAGSAEGTFTLKNSDGKYISNPSSTTISLTDSGADLNITCGDGTSKILLTSTASATTVRNLFFRMNNGVPQFRFYSTANATTSGYSSVLTIWKAD